MSTAVVSVIMATYNHVRFVRMAIESALAQTGVDFEFLIADDGSVDGTEDVVASFDDPRIRFFPHAMNRGAAVVTNELISRASGEFIALLNSDDYWPVADKLATQVSLLRANPDVAASFGRPRFIDQADRQLSKASLPFGGVFDQENRSQGAWLKYFFEHGNCICHPTMLIRRACYDHLQMYDNRYRQLPDLDMWVRLVKKYQILISDDEWVAFRILPNENASSQTVENSIRTMNEHYLIADSFFDGVGRDLLREAFGGDLRFPEMPTDEHLDIEKALLYFLPGGSLGRAYRLMGIQKVSDLLKSARHRIVLSDVYGIDDRWFHHAMGEVDVLRPRAALQVARGLQPLRRLKAALKMFRV